MSNNFGNNTYNYGQPNVGFTQQQSSFVPPGGEQNPSMYPQVNQPYPSASPGYPSYPGQSSGPNVPYPISPMVPAGGTQGFNQPYPSASPGYPPSDFNSPYPPASGNIPNASGFNAPYPPGSTGNVSNPSPYGSPYPPASGNVSNPSTFSSAYPPASGNVSNPSTFSSAYPPASGNISNPSAFGSPYPSGNMPNPSAGGNPSNPGYGSHYPTSTSYGQTSNATPGSSSSSFSSFPASESTRQSGYPQDNQRTTYPNIYPQTTSSPAYSSNMPTSGYPSSSTISFAPERPTVRASTSFDAVADATVLRKAMKGIGTDEKAIINVLGRRTSAQKQQIILSYQQSYGRDLLRDLKSELGGTLEQVIVALMMPLSVYLASELYKAMKGIGTKESVLIEILCTQDNNMIRTIKADYLQAYKRPLEKDIQDDTSGDFKRLLISVCAGARQEGSGDAAMAQRLAHELYKAGEGRWGTNDSEFNKIMAAYSRNQLRLVFAEYRKIKGRTVEDAIKSELSGEFKSSMLALYDSIENRPAYFAKKLREAMAGLGTNDNALIRLIVSRCELDLGSIKEQYQTLYKKTLDSAVASETSGDYKRILLVLLQD